MNRSLELVVLEIAGHRVGVCVSAVARVVHAVEITALPEVPEIVMGVINVEGRVVPVINVRRRFHFPEREVDPADFFVLARTSHREVALPVDRVIGVDACSAADVTGSDEILPGLNFIEGVVRREDGLILIHDLEKFLTFDEEESLERLVKA